MRIKGWLIMAVCVFAMLGIVLGLRMMQRLERAGDADRLYAAGEYEAARLIYLELGDANGAARCVEGYREARYREAERLLGVGDYEGAEEILRLLIPYRDSAALLDDCAYLRAEALAESGDALAARKLYLSLGDYPGCAEAVEALTPALYEEAMELAQSARLEKACALWHDFTDYRDSALLLARGERALAQMADKTRVKLNDPSRKPEGSVFPGLYVSDEAYFLFPEEPGPDTRFFLYFPGGRNEEINIDFLLIYLANPAPNTLAVFLRRNGVPDMEGSCEKGLRLLDEAAADCGVFVDRVLVAGSSLGAYPALQCPRIAEKRFAVEVPTVLSLDAANGWRESELVPNREECLALAKTGAHYYLFQPVWLDDAYAPVGLMVQTGNWVMLAGCLRDDHEQITYDAMGMGVIDWALTDTEAPCPADIYSFRRLRTEN